MTEVRADAAADFKRIEAVRSNETARKQPGAAVRDMKFNLARMLGKLPDGPPAYPPIETGAILTGSRGAGTYFRKW